VRVRASIAEKTRGNKQAASEAASDMKTLLLDGYEVSWDAYEFLRAMFHMNPRRRATIPQLMNSPYMRS